MFSVPSADEVFEELGDKVVSAFSAGVDLTRAELHKYRTEHPQWVSDQTERGLAGWIHDRMFKHITDPLYEVDDILVIDREPTREIWFGTKYRIRVKRHSGPFGLTRSYPTTAALFFLTGVQAPIPGMEKYHLNVGYVWDKVTRSIMEGVISLPEGLHKNHWVEELPVATRADGVVAFPAHTVNEPTMPSFEIGGRAVGSQNKRDDSREAGAV